MSRHGILKSQRCLSLSGSNFASVAKLLPMAEMASDCLACRGELGHDPPGPVAELVDPPELLVPTGKGREGDQFAVLAYGQRAVGAGDSDPEIRRARIAAGVSDRRDGPLLLGLAQVVGHADVDVAGRPVLSRPVRHPAAESRRPVPPNIPPPAAPPPPGPPPRAPLRASAAHRYTLHGQLECRTGADGFDFVRAFLEVVAGDGPAVRPQQRPDVQHAGAAPVEVGLVMAGELLYAVAEVEQTEVARADDAAAGADEEACRRPGAYPCPCGR